jgi:two-component system response regulator PilR (NtrC family)
LHPKGAFGRPHQVTLAKETTKIFYIILIMADETKQDPVKGSFLIVDDEENIREILAATLKPIAGNVIKAGSAEEALGITMEENLDVVICDIQMPGMNGLEFLHKVKEEQPDIKFLMITAFGTMETVIQAMRFGASDFLTKPFDNAKVRDICQRLVNEKNERLEPVIDPAHSSSIQGIIGESEGLKKCLNIALKAAASSSNVLILGESGTGKEVLARAIHDNSDRKDKPFIPINCGAIPENLLESELFGYEKGAFTGALENKPGKFVLAQKGTIFLDEIGEMPQALQVKLLRVLQEKVVDPVGSTQSTPVDFRLLSATNCNLDDDVQKGEFREDLYYRLNIIPILLPPLRDRGRDVIILAEYFLKQFNRRYSTHYNLTESCIKQLMDHTWPGNIRELENVLERAVVLGEKDELVLLMPKTSPSGLESSHIPDFKARKREHEREEIIQALERNRWNKTRTAGELGISRRSAFFIKFEFLLFH